MGDLGRDAAHPAPVLASRDGVPRRHPGRARKTRVVSLRRPEGHSPSLSSNGLFLLRALLLPPGVVGLFLRCLLGPLLRRHRRPYGFIGIESLPRGPSCARMNPLRSSETVHSASQDFSDSPSRRQPPTLRGSARRPARAVCASCPDRLTSKNR